MAKPIFILFFLNISDGQYYTADYKDLIRLRAFKSAEDLLEPAFVVHGSGSQASFPVGIFSSKKEK